MALLAFVWRAAQRNALRVGRRAAMTQVAMACLLLLPVISVSDDLLMAKQATLPAAAQTYNLAHAGASTGLDLIPTALATLAFLQFPPMQREPLPKASEHAQTYRGRTLRTRSLRAPPAFAS